MEIAAVIGAIVSAAEHPVAIAVGASALSKAGEDLYGKTKDHLRGSNTVGTAKSIQGWEEFTLEVREADGKLHFTSRHGTALHADQNGRVRMVQSPQLGDWEAFEVVDGGLRTAHNTFIQVTPGGSVKQNSVMGGKWEHITLVRLPNGKCAIQSGHGTYITARPP
ncbi:hypothetical protein AB1Y20_012703 [Prymnesium parvum]|uniref:Fascin domain-containing protein n=1 Tax=Prymnesium parvum TaxID=97485 RepID=A0AB34ILF4_PRYPA